MTQVRNVEERLLNLKNAVSEEDINPDLKEIVEDLGHALSSNVSDKDGDYICSLVFDFENGIPFFLTKCGPSKDPLVASAVSDILKILCVFMEKKNISIQLYANSLQKQCIRISVGAAASSRTAAISTISALTRNNARNGYSFPDFNAKDLYKILQEQYVATCPVGVRAMALETMGTIARYYENELEPLDIDRLKKWSFNNLENQLKEGANDKERGLIQGSLFCFQSLLHCNVCKIEAHSNDSDRLFKILFRVFQGWRNEKNLEPVRAALKIFRDHIDLFSNLLLFNAEKLYEILDIYARHRNRDVYRYGIGAFETLLRQLSAILYPNIDGRRERNIYDFIMSKFFQTLENAEDLENIYYISIAIRGIGYFAKICSKLMVESDVTALRNSLVRNSDWFYADANLNQKDYLRHVPAFIKAYTMFAEDLDIIPTELMETLHQMADIFIMGYHDIGTYHRNNGVYNIHLLLCMLYKKGEGILRNFLDSFFEKALLRTCTNVVSPDDEDQPAYTTLLYFWKTILSKPIIDELGIKLENLQEKEISNELDTEQTEDIHYLYEDVPDVDPTDLVDSLYDCFFNALLKSIKKFDLKLKNTAEKDDNDDEETKIASVSSTLKPINQKDFLLFQNLVEFWCSLLKKLDSERLVDWVYIVGTELIEQSVANPLVSGLYKMMSEVLIVCESRDLFYGCKNYLSQSRKNQNSAKLSEPSDYITFLIFREYLKEVWHRLQQYTDELLASCLRLILAYPIEFFDITELILPLKKALHLGISYHPLADIAMNSLDKLLNPSLGYDIDSNFLSNILPCINEYLLVGVVSASEDGPVVKKKKYKIFTATEMRHQALKNVLNSDRLGVLKSGYSDLPELQLRMMQFLGRLGGKNKQLLLKGNNAIQDSNMLAWDPIKRIKIRVPFRNAKVYIYMDEFLPRICELAESSPDRQVKVAACELLHGIVIYMIGSAAFQARDTRNAKESSFHVFYLKIFPVMLRLAIDPDQVARDLYSSLFTQIIHWLTNNAHAENPETIALLKTCLDAACNPDAGLRDYGAECIQEFVKWSIKQSSRATDGSQNIKSLLKRLYNLMSSPSASKRFGASLVFNRIYRLFREERVLVNEYTIEILGQLFLSLEMAEADHPSIGTRDQIIESISHIKRIIRTKAADFILRDETRHHFIGDSKVNDLESVVRWTFKESGKVQSTYAKVCMNFFAEFVLLLPKIKTPKDWLKKEIIANPNHLVDVFEGNTLDMPINLSNNEKASSSFLSWIKKLNSTVDGYIWLIERKVAEPEDLIGGHNSKLDAAIKLFIENKPHDILQNKLESNIIEKNKIMSIYSHISVRLIYFFDLVIKKSQNGLDSLRQKQTYLGALTHPNFAEIVAKTLLLPKNTSELIQLDQGNAVTNSGVNRVFNIAKDFIMTISSQQDIGFAKKLMESVANSLKAYDVSLLVSKEYNSDRSSIIETIQTVEGIKLIQSLGLLDMMCQNANKLNSHHPDNSEKYCVALMDQYLSLCKRVQGPLWVEFLGKTVDVCFSQPGLAEVYASHLLGFTGPLEILSHSEKTEVFQKFSEYIFDCISSHFGVFSVVLANHIMSSIVRDYLFMYFEYLKVNRLKRRKVVAGLTDYLVKDPSFLSTMFTQWKTDDQLLDLIVCLKSLLGADPGIMSRSRGKPVFHLLWDIFIGLINKKRAFKVKNAALDLLPVYISLDDDYVKTVVDILEDSFVSQFPPETEDLKKGTILYNGYISTLDKLLNTMTSFKSVAIFNLLKVTFVQEKYHIHEKVIKDSVKNFSSGLGLKSFLDISQSCFELFKDKNYSILHRHNLAKLIVSILAGVNDGHVVVFYERNIVYLLSSIQTEVSMNPKHQVIDWSEKADCLLLVRALYDRLHKGLLDDSNSINDVWMKASENHQGKKMEQVLYVVYTTFRKTPLLSKGTGDDNTRQIAQYNYNRSIFNTWASVILCRYEKPKLYETFLGAVKPSLPSPWEYIIDPAQKIYLPLELDSVMPKYKLEELRAVSGYSSEKDDRNVAYMASLALSGSSFAQASLVETVLEGSGNNKHLSSEDTVMDEVIDEDTTVIKENDNQEEYDIEYEVDVLNENEFMKYTTELIKKAHEKVSSEEEIAKGTPSWLSRLLKCFIGYEYETVYQLYIAKAVINYPFAFEKHASRWILPLMQLATKGSQYGEAINYFVQDICIVLGAWGRNTEIPSPESSESKRIMFAFMEHLIRNAYHPTARITRRNIQLIKIIFENWGKAIPVPTRAIYEQFTHKDDYAHKNAVGLQILSIILSNGENPYQQNYELDPLHDLSEIKFHTDMGANIKYRGLKSKDNSTYAAELMSWTVKDMKERTNPNLATIMKIYENYIIGLFQTKRNNSLQFLKCFNCLCTHDTEIGEQLLSLVTGLMKDLSSEEKLYALKCIDACWKEDDDIYYNLKHGISRMISSRNVDIQINILKVLNKIFHAIPPTKIKPLIKQFVHSYSKHENIECRSLYYSFLRKVYLQNKSASVGSTGIISEQGIKALLLEGLIDKNKDIAREVHEFIETSLQIEDDIYTVLTKITSELYTPETEEIYLLYATSMILNNTKKSYDFNTPIFDNPLPNARFDANYRRIDTSWQNTLSMLPLFRPTQENTFNEEVIELQLQKTQSLLDFSTTQGKGQSLISTFNPISKETDKDVDMDVDSAIDNAISDSSSKAQGIKIKAKNPYYNSRYVKTPKGALSILHSNRNEKLEKKARQLLNTKKEAMEKKVTLTRLYREGELPDVQIEHKDILLPLEVLASADFNIARLLYSSLVVSLVKENPDERKDNSAYQRQVVTLIRDNLLNSKLHFTPTIGSFLRILYDLNVTSVRGDIIKNASSKSFNHHIGIVLLENQLMLGEDTPKAEKRTRTEEVSLSAPVERWIDLSILYKEISESEIFRNIYLDHVASSELPKLAIQAEIKGHYVEAFNIFHSACQDEQANKNEYQLWSEEQLHCLTQLSQWGDLAYTIYKTADNGKYENLWTSEDQSAILGYFVKSFSKFKSEAIVQTNNNEIWSSGTPNPIYKFLDNAADDIRRKNYLLKNYACDWTMAAIYRKQYDLGTQYISHSYDSLLAAWTTLHPLAHTSRLAKLGQLERTVEIEDYLKLIKKVERGYGDPVQVEDFLKTLTSRYPDPHVDSMEIWDDIIQSRITFIEDLFAHNAKFNEKRLLDKFKVSFMKAKVDTAIIQNNKSSISSIPLAYRELGERNEEELLNVRLYQYNLINIEEKKRPSTIFKAFTKTLAYQLPTNSSKSELFETRMILAKSFEVIKDELLKQPALYDTMMSIPTVKKHIANNGLGSKYLEKPEYFLNYLEDQGYKMLEEAEEAAKEYNSTHVQLLWKFGNYCDRSLRAVQNSSSMFQPDINSLKYSEIVITCYLQAIDKGCMEAAEYFPRLLELIELHPETGPMFHDSSIKYGSSWQFIRWIPQLVSYIDSEMSTYVFPLLTRIAESYPKALYYPFQISCEYYPLKKGSMSEEKRRPIERILELIHSTLMEKFSFELQRLADPIHTVKDYIDYIRSICTSDGVPDSYIKSLHKKLEDLVLNPYDSKSGPVAKEFQTKHGAQLVNMMGSQGKKLTDERQFQKIRKFVNELSDMYNRSAATLLPKSIDPNLLKSHAPWLASFKNSDFDEQMEIPGQYTGLSKPYPELHAKVANFDAQVLNMASIRRPKRICINGTDEKQYYFLVKAGEDLRADQRIEQAFTVMNDMIKKNSFCSKQNIQLTTYRVVPMSSILGIIEWVSNTKPLARCIQDQLNDKMKWGRMREKYMDWVKPKRNGSNDQYLKKYLLPREKIIEKFDYVTNIIPHTIVRDYLFTLSASPEAFLFLRKDFAYSLACISIFGYILGIGDRHLENSLIDTKSGRLIPIDFGHAFGSATDSLGIPELVPFRLTPQLEGALEPLGISGILLDAMTNILEAIQSEKELLFNILNVFVKEPSLDWRKFAINEIEKQNKGTSMDDNSNISALSVDDIQFYPERKLEIVRLKLERTNPAVTVSMELSNGHQGKGWLDSAIAVAKGNPEHNIRARAKETCLDANEQVRCLIDLATDKNILGVMYAGWMSFV